MHGPLPPYWIPSTWLTWFTKVDWLVPLMLMNLMAHRMRTRQVLKFFKRLTQPPKALKPTSSLILKHGQKKKHEKNTKQKELQQIRTRRNKLRKKKNREKKKGGKTHEEKPPSKTKPKQNQPNKPKQSKLKPWPVKAAQFLEPWI